MLTEVELEPAHDSAISAHMNSLRENRGAKNWLETLSEITENAANMEITGTHIKQRINSDLWWRKDGIDHYMSIKTVKPNIDQTAVAKQDLLRLTFSNPDCRVYFGLYYNPYGEDRALYAHNPPMGIFDFRRDDAVLIGRDYWETLGGEGCYDEILGIAESVGAETRSMIEKLR